MQASASTSAPSLISSSYVPPSSPSPARMRSAPSRSDLLAPNNTEAPQQAAGALEHIVAKIALFALNAFGFWLNSYIWTMSVLVGFVFRQEVKERISDLFQAIIWNTDYFALKLVLPTAFLFYWLNLPAAITTTVVLSGVDAGSRIALGIDKYRRTASTIINFEDDGR